MKTIKISLIILMLLSSCINSNVYEGTQVIYRIEESNDDNYKYMLEMYCVPNNVYIHTNNEYQPGDTLTLLPLRAF